MAISPENRTEFHNEKRAKELKRRGYHAHQIAAMMESPHNNIREQHVKKWLKHQPNTNEMRLDGKL